ncbi:hypothetical protein BJX99DRAFT_108027 [Aspergillus californicus]
MYRRLPPRRHACTRCVQLKVKCVPIAEGSCQRCTRLGHPPCVFPAEARGKNASKSPQQTKSTEHTRPNDGEDCMLFELIKLQQATILLAKYREKKMPQFPFIVIPETDVMTLHTQSPFLLLCILTASQTDSLPLRDKPELLIRKELASRVIVGIERNMDLLQGLLVHIAWQHYHWRTFHTHMYMLLQLAIMIVVDLGLDREGTFRMQAIPTDRSHQHDSQPSGQGAQTLNATGMRALLGCYYVVTKFSLFRRQLHMRHTDWIEQCAETLSQSPEHPTDKYLKAYIDVQALAGQSHALFHERRYPDHPSPNTWDQILDLMTRQQTEREQLLSATKENNWPLRIELLATPALILGQALSHRRDVFKLQELNKLHLLTTSAFQVVDTWLEIPSTVAMHLPANAYNTIWYCMLALCKLSLLFDSDSTETVAVGKKNIYERGVAIIQRFEEMSRSEDVWLNSKEVVGTMLAWLERTSSGAENQRGPAVSTSRLGGNGNHDDADKRPLEHEHTWEGQGVDISQPSGWLATEAPGTVVSSDMQFHPTELDTAMWQQMLDNFTWFGPGLEDTSSFSTYGM